MTNPILLNDLRKNWFRRRPVHAVAMIAILILVLLFAVIGGVTTLFGWGSQYPLWRFPDLLLPVIAPAFAAGSFAREHEQRTWQDILLTRLSAFEIVSGKLFACFLPTLAMIVVLFPAYSMVLIIQEVHWALVPGPWIAIVAIRFLVTAVFYLAVSLVCSYHSTNARMSLVIGYVALALYTLVSFFAWRMLFDSGLIPDVFDSNASRRTDGGSNGLLTLSRDEFGFSVADALYITQSAALCIVLLGYLLGQVRRRQAPNA